MTFNKKKLIGALLITVTLGVNTTSVFAGPNVIKTTDGEVSFTADDNATGPVTKPGTPSESIVPEEELDKETGTAGPLRIEHLPAMKFGAQKISSQNKIYEAIWEKFREVDANGAAIGDALNIAHFAQVTDERGVGGTFRLKVASTTFKKVDSNGVAVVGKLLPGTHIEFSEAQLKNTNGDVTSTSGKKTEDILKTIDVITPKALPNDSSSVEIMAVKTGKTTDGSKSTVVFNSDYSNLAPSDTATTTNSGIKLVVPGSDIKERDASYVATLTWTLEDTI